MHESKARYRVMPCGRRFGKTTLVSILLSETMLDGYPTAYYAPTYKQLAFVWRDIKTLLAPVIKDKSETEHRIELLTGGTLDMWSLDTDRPGVGRKYKRAAVDEAGMCGNLEEQWTEAIRPTLTDLRGDALFAGTPKGRNYFWRLYCHGLDPLYLDWECWQMPTTANPYIDAAEVEAARQMLPERAFLQEYMADFIEESGGVFRKVREAVDIGRRENEEPQDGRWYYGGADLARVADFTVITIFDDTGKQVYFERFNQISWERQVDCVVNAAIKYGAMITIDTTGVGDPVFEQIATRLADKVKGKSSRASVRPFHFTNTTKTSLIDNYALLLERSGLRLMDISEQTNELLSFQYELTAHRNIIMSAPVGMNDDCVISGALGVDILRTESHPRTQEPPPENQRTVEYIKWQERQSKPKETEAYEW